MPRPSSQRAIECIVDYEDDGFRCRAFLRNRLMGFNSFAGVIFLLSKNR
jgi:hypothetical protein